MNELDAPRIGLNNDENQEIDYDNLSVKPGAQEQNLRDSQVLMKAFGIGDIGIGEATRTRMLPYEFVTLPSQNISQNQIGLVQQSNANYNRDLNRYTLEFTPSLIDPRDPEFTSNVSSMRSIFDAGREVYDYDE